MDKSLSILISSLATAFIVVMVLAFGLAYRYVFETRIVPVLTQDVSYSLKNGQ